jgi:hypothetical protein
VNGNCSVVFDGWGFSNIIKGEGNGALINSENERNGNIWIYFERCNFIDIIVVTAVTGGLFTIKNTNNEISFTYCESLFIYLSIWLL